MGIEIPKFNVRTNAAGDETYTRVRAVGCDFKDGALPTVDFHREDKMTSASGAMSQYDTLPMLRADATDLSKSFPVLDPTTGAVTDMTYGQFLWIFYQFWLSVEADNTPVEPVIP